MNLEFFGLPAAGKSTLSRALVDQLRSSNTLVRAPTMELKRGVSRPRRIALRSCCAAMTLRANPSAAIRMIRATVRSDQARRMDFLYNVYNWLYVYRFANLHDAIETERIDVFDQGTLQSIWSIVLSSTALSDDDLDELLSCSYRHPERTVLVVVECDPTVIKNRIRSREHPNSRVSPDGVPYSITDAATAKERVLNRISTHEKSFDSVITVRSNAKGDIRPAVVQISEKIDW